MKSRLVRRVLVALGIMVTLGAAAAESRACCLFRKSTTAYYAPVVAAPACNTCNYVPQVTYRSVFTSVPVTTYRPITTVNPCTGCPQTMVQPVTTYRMQPSLVPVTTYRPVASCCYAPACPTGACGAPACATGACGAAAPVASTYYAPAYSAAPAAPGCSSCTGGAGRADVCSAGCSQHRSAEPVAADAGPAARLFDLARHADDVRPHHVRRHRSAESSDSGSECRGPHDPLEHRCPAVEPAVGPADCPSA